MPIARDCQRPPDGHQTPYPLRADYFPTSLITDQYLSPGIHTLFAVSTNARGCGVSLPRCW
jgi:hypothetical protein